MISCRELNVLNVKIWLFFYGYSEFLLFLCYFADIWSSKYMIIKKLLLDNLCLCCIFIKLPPYPVCAVSDSLIKNEYHNECNNIFFHITACELGHACGISGKLMSIRFRDAFMFCLYSQGNLCLRKAGVQLKYLCGATVSEVSAQKGVCAARVFLIDYWLLLHTSEDLFL